VGLLASAMALATALGAGAGHWLAGPGAPRGFQLRHLAVRGAQHLSGAALADALGLRAGLPLRSLDPDRLRQRLLRNPWVRRARVLPLPPSRLLVALEERRAQAWTTLGRPRRPFWVDATGTPFAPAERTAVLPQLRGVAGLAQGMPDARLRQGITILDALAARHLPRPAAIQLGGGASPTLPVLIFPRRDPPGSLAVVLGGGALDRRLDRLERLWSARLPEVDAARTIDLRFGEQVILRSRATEGGREKAWHAGKT